MPVVIGGDNLPSPIGIGLTDLPNIGGASGPPGPPSSGTTAVDAYRFYTKLLFSIRSKVMCYTTKCNLA